MPTYPEKYWHCYVKLEGNKSYAVENDMTFAHVKEKILTPLDQSRPFTVSGKIVSDPSKLEEIKLTHTTLPLNKLAVRFERDNAARNVMDLGTDRQLLPVWQGQDHTYDLLYAGKKQDAPDAEIALVDRVCARIANVARIIGKRTRKGKASYCISDEYDVQDLLHAVLRAYLKYSVQEDPLPKTAGTRSGRADISIQELGILIEIKYVRSPDDQKRIFDDFSRDLVLYPSWAPLKTLLYLIYNSTDLADPEALQKLSGRKDINGKPFDVRIILA